MNLRLLRVISSMTVVIFFCSIVTAASDQSVYAPNKQTQTTNKRIHRSNSKTQPEAAQPQTEYEYNAPDKQNYPQPNNDPMTNAHKMISF